MLLRLRQLAALLITVGILGGIPYLLTSLVTWPIVDMSWLSVQAHLRGWRLPPGVVTTVLLGSLWIVWAIYLLAVAAETTAWLRRRPVRRRPFGPLQILAATALGTLTTTGAAAPGLVETVASAPQHTDITEDSEQAASVEQQPEDEDVEPAYEQRERSRTIPEFGYDSAEISDLMRTDLESTIELISQHGALDTPVVVVGHTDVAGDADYNQALSERRAEVVAEYVREELGEDAPTIETHGRGHDELLADATDAEQRRVEITYTITTPVAEESEPAAEPSEESADSGESVDGPAVLVQLPSGAVTGLAAGAAAAAGAAGGYAFGVRRRLDDQAPPATAHRFPTSVPSEEPADDQGTEEHAGSSGTSAPSESDGQPRPGDAATVVGSRVLAALAHSPGVGLEGPEAHGAARALLATALGTADTDPEVRLVLCSDDARHLLGDGTTTLLAERDTPGVAVVDTFPAALTAVHTTIVERQHQLDQAEAENVDALCRDGDGARAVLPLVLLTRSHTDHEAELSGLLLRAEGLDITAVILDRWPLGGTLTIDDGTVTNTSSPLNLLHGVSWPTVTSQHIHDLLNEHPHRTPASPPDPALQTATDDAHDHDDECAPHPSVAAPAEDSHTAQAHPVLSVPPNPDPPVDEGVQDVDGSALPSPHPEPDGPPAPLEGERGDEVAAQEAAEGARPTEGSTTTVPSPHPHPVDARKSASAREPSPGTPRPIQVHLMGRIHLTIDGARVEVPRRAAFELAAYLALHPDGARLERAITDMWPDEDPRRTTRRFHDAARTLRHLGPRETDSEPVIRDAEVYRLNPAVVAVDLWDLEAALADVENTDDLDGRHTLIQRAADLYTGGLAAEADYVWIEPARARLRERTTDILRRHATTLTDHPDVAAAVLQRAVDLHPDDEQLHATLIRHLLDHHHTQEAKRAYTAYSERMRHLGTHPDPKLRDLLEKTRTE